MSSVDPLGLRNREVESRRRRNRVKAWENRRQTASNNRLGAIRNPESGGSSLVAVHAAQGVLTHRKSQG